jgi:hypothetical protein
MSANSVIRTESIANTNNTNLPYLVHSFNFSPKYGLNRENKKEN